MRPSQTAQLAAAHRAYHLMNHEDPILKDSAAIWMLEPRWRSILRVGVLRVLFWERLLRRVRPISTFAVVRSRYTEDALARRITKGCRQYVILGAGLDSWELRHASPEVRVFELDHPATQQWKKARIHERLGELPSHLV
jgi:methyltransferase (TIGR00027 family)